MIYQRIFNCNTVTYVLLAAVAVSLFALALVHCDALSHGYRVEYYA